MKVINNSNQLYYLKSIKLNDNQNIDLEFRQADEFIFKNDCKHINEYLNYTLSLTFDDDNTAKKEYLFIQNYFLNQSLSIDLINENTIELIGDIDYTIKVKKYEEKIIEQLIEDWKSRYLHATKFIFEQIEINSNYAELIKEIATEVNKSDEKLAEIIFNKISKFEKENNIRLNHRIKK